MQVWKNVVPQRLGMERLGKQILHA
jgi:hypothetical protein